MATKLEELKAAYDAYTAAETAADAVWDDAGWYAYEELRAAEAAYDELRAAHHRVLLDKLKKTQEEKSNDC
jgi:hypothetical protein